MATVVGSAFLGVSVTPVGKQVFLLVVTTIPNAMRRMATTAGMVKKNGRWSFKKSAVGGKKTSDCKPLPNPPQGAGIHSRCALGGYDCAPFLEKDWNMNIIWAFFFPVGKVRMGPVVDGTHPRQLCRSCDYAAQG